MRWQLVVELAGAEVVGDGARSGVADLFNSWGSFFTSFLGPIFGFVFVAKKGPWSR